MNALIKKILLTIPSVKSYVKSVNATRNENIDLRRLLLEKDNLIKKSRSPVLFCQENDFLTERLMSHPVKSIESNFVLDSIHTKHIENRVAVAERLISSYHKAIDDESKSSLKRDGEDLWTGLLRNELPDLLNAIESRNPVQLSDFLMNFGKSYVWFGGITTCIDGYNKDLNSNHIAMTYKDKLSCLAESIGAIRAENPESGPWGENLNLSTQDLVSLIESELEIDIKPPMGIIHTDGVRAGEHLYHYRHINALYSATRIKSLNNENQSICEFGGGLGITAMYSRRLGVKNYTILDLPITCLLAGHYLIHAVGWENVSLYGEEQKENSIKLLPYWECQSLPDNHFGFAINQDSFPEISDNLILEYLTQIKRTVRNEFLSINHECFHPRTVNNFALQSGGFKKIHRSKCWVREGYVEELYSIN